MSPYEMALTERLAIYTGWLALAVSSHPLVTLRTRTVVTRGAKWSLALACLLTALSLLLAPPIAPSLLPTLPATHAFMPHLSWAWGCCTWLGVLALFLRDRPSQSRWLAWWLLCMAVACGLCVNVMWVDVAVRTQVPW